MFQYPGSIHDRPEALLGLVGSFWSEIYEDRERLAEYMFARAQLNLQSFRNLQEAAAALSRQQTPLLHTERWQQLTLRESETNSSVASLLRYGDGTVYGLQPASGRLYHYGVPSQEYNYAYPLPAGLTDVRFICNLLSDPSRVLVKDVDFYIDTSRQGIFFRSNPFADPLISVAEEFTGDQVTDRLASLWLFQSRWDWQFLDTHWGYVLGLTGPPTTTYRDFLNSIFDGLVLGGNKAQVEQALSAVLDAPLCRYQGEVVQDIVETDNERLTITNRAIYKAPRNSESMVNVGDRLSLGQQLCDTLQIYELTHGTVPEALRALTLAGGFLVGGYRHGISFANRIVPLKVSTDAQGYTRAEFEVGGLPEDVRKFWDHVHTQGIASGETFAQLLDQRDNPTGQPAAGNLPATINPLEFLVQNLLRNNVFVAVLRTSQQGRQALPLTMLEAIRRILPPQTALILVLQLDLPGESIILEGPGDATTPGYTESLQFHLGLPTFGDTVSPSLITESLSFRIAGDGCIS